MTLPAVCWWFLEIYNPVCHAVNCRVTSLSSTGVTHAEPLPSNVVTILNIKLSSTVVVKLLKIGSIILESVLGVDISNILLVSTSLTTNILYECFHDVVNVQVMVVSGVAHTVDLYSFRFPVDVEY